MQNTDSLLHLHAYWANVEHNIGKDLAGARGVWNSFLKKRFCKLYLLHLIYYRFKFEIIQVDYNICQNKAIWFTMVHLYLVLSSGGMLAAWYAYIDMEVHLGHIKEARSIYRRCYTRKFDGTGSEVCPRFPRFMCYRNFYFVYLSGIS